VALVLGLSIALFGVVLLLARDVRRRAVAERALAEALAFRKAMEDSLITGLRARDLTAHHLRQPGLLRDGRFQRRRTAPRRCRPTGRPSRSASTAAPAQRAAGGRRPQRAREGFETVFMRKQRRALSGHDLRGAAGRWPGPHTGWMSTVLDVSAQRRIEELSRQQQDRLQATARLATVGEMASLLSHELNQPLAAIASYASGSLNLLDGARPADTPRRCCARRWTRIAEQAERAGRVIKSVHRLRAPARAGSARRSAPTC
jgi:two-component system sensor histidine kinase DctS